MNARKGPTTWSGITSADDSKNGGSLPPGRAPGVPAARVGASTPQPVLLADEPVVPGVSANPAPDKVEQPSASEPLPDASANSTADGAIPGAVSEGAYAERLPAAAYEKGAIKLHQSRMSVWKGNPRHTIDDEDLDALAQSMRKMGQESALQVVPDPDKPGHYLILCGQRRWKATKDYELNEGYLYAVVRTDLKSEAEMYAVAIETQAHTRSLNMLDYALSLNVASEVGVRALANSLGKQAGDVSKLQQIGKLPETVLNVIRRSLAKFSMTFGYELVLVNKTRGEEKALELAERILADDLTVKQTQQIREAMVAGDPAPRPERPKSEWSFDTKNAFGRVQVREETRDVKLDLKGIPEEKYRAFKDALDRLLAPAS